LTEWKREAGILKKMRHPRILKFYGVCVEEPHLYIVTELASLSMHDLIAAKSKRFRGISVNATIDDLKASFPIDDTIAATSPAAGAEQSGLSPQLKIVEKKKIASLSPVHEKCLEGSFSSVTGGNDDARKERSTSTLNPLFNPTSSGKIELKVLGKDQRLQARWKSEDRLVVVTEIAGQLLEALAFIHEKNIIHRGHAHVDFRCPTLLSPFLLPPLRPPLLCGVALCLS